MGIDSDVGRDIGRGVGRDIGRGVGRDIGRGVGRDIGRDRGRDVDGGGKTGAVPSPLAYIGSKWSRTDFDS